MGCVPPTFTPPTSTTTVCLRCMRQYKEKSVTRRRHAETSRGNVLEDFIVDEHRQREGLEYDLARERCATGVRDGNGDPRPYRIPGEERIGAREEQAGR